MISLLSIPLSLPISLFLSGCLSICLYVCLSVFQSVYLSDCLSLNLGFIFAYLSITNDCSRPRHRCRSFNEKSRVDSEGKDVVEVVDEADDEGHAAEEDQNVPERFPARTLSQADVVEPVGGGPQVEP